MKHLKTFNEYQHDTPPDGDPLKIDYIDRKKFKKHSSLDIIELDNDYYFNYHSIKKMNDGIWIVDKTKEFYSISELVEYCVNNTKINEAREYFKNILNNMVISKENIYKFNGEDIIELNDIHEYYLISNKIWLEIENIIPDYWAVMLFITDELNIHFNLNYNFTEEK